MLKSTKPTTRAYFREGKIKGQKVTGKWYITEDNLKKISEWRLSCAS